MNATLGLAGDRTRPAPPFAIEDVRAVAQAIAPHIRRTRLQPQGRRWVKDERVQPTGSYAIRGALARLLLASPHERSRGMVVACREAEATAFALAARESGVPTMLVTRDSAATSSMEVIVVQGDPRPLAWRASLERCLAYVDPEDDPLVLAGYATVGLEILDELPAVQWIDTVGACGPLARAVGAISGCPVAVGCGGVGRQNAVLIRAR